MISSRSVSFNWPIVGAMVWDFRIELSVDGSTGAFSSQGLFSVCVCVCVHEDGDQYLARPARRTSVASLSVVSIQGSEALTSTRAS